LLNFVGTEGREYEQTPRVTLKSDYSLQKKTARHKRQQGYLQ